ISKEAVNRAGYEIPGHTEHLAQQTGVENPIMMLVNNGLRIGLCTTHIPLKEVPFQITEERIILMIRNMADSLNRDFGIDTPRLAVLGLNPHAGDGGTLGIEEQRIIAPAIDKARSGSVDIEGPFPADGLFGSRNYTQYDGILAMYHDQGLIPFKALSFGKGVNFTAGLPIIRTSPDHGTAFDIAGKNRANATSFKQALELAADLVRIRKSQPA
ncbi:MAG: 4-hydroxythreonine-4-phosphate dehydrogenase PdxA, partial [Balneolaceae bacterium]|nr:4-hydroxythreonine-4-phosphate dehydrogenase PdxA [Balneolaceae bacterium]